MTATVTVTLPNELYLKAQAWAEQSGRPLADFLAEMVEVSLVPFESNPGSVIVWTDQQLHEAIDERLLAADDARLSDLLSRQQNNPIQLSASESSELGRLMIAYQHQLLVKSAALREAVRRGIIPPPAP